MYELQFDNTKYCRQYRSTIESLLIFGQKLFSKLFSDGKKIQLKCNIVKPMNNETRYIDFGKSAFFFAPYTKWVIQAVNSFLTHCDLSKKWNVNSVFLLGWRVTLAAVYQCVDSFQFNNRWRHQPNRFVKDVWLRKSS